MGIVDYTPMFEETGVKPRDYQVEIINEAIRSMTDGSDIKIKLPVGAGAGFIIAAIATIYSRMNSNVLWLTRDAKQIREAMSTLDHLSRNRENVIRDGVVSVREIEYAKKVCVDDDANFFGVIAYREHNLSFNKKVKELADYYHKAKVLCIDTYLDRELLGDE